jgi:hypothetical protein
MKLPHFSKIFLVVLCIVFLASQLWYHHTFRFPSDYKMESNLRSFLEKHDKFLLSNILDEGDSVCFLNHYAVPSQIEEYVTEDSLVGLDRIISGMTGIGDHVWWIVVLNRRNVVDTFRMSFYNRPNIKNVLCLPLKKALVSKNRLERNTIYFDIQSTD